MGTRMMKSKKLLHGIAAGIAGLLFTGLTHADPPSTPAPAPATPAPTTEPSDPREAAILSDRVQLTSGFDKAGEAYFSPDMKWIIFQASPKGMPHYQMYVAPLKWEGDKIIG